MAQMKYIRELEAGTPVGANELAYDDGTTKAKKVMFDNIPVKFNRLEDTPNDMDAHPGKRVEVNPQGSALIYVDAPVTVYREVSTSSQDHPISTSWVDITSITLSRDIEKATARFYHSLHVLEQGNRSGVMHIGIKVNGVDPTTYEEHFISEEFNATISGFDINGETGFSQDDVLTLVVRGQGNHNNFDLNIKGSLEQSYFGIFLTDSSGTPGVSDTGWTYFGGSLPVFSGTTDGIDTIQFGSQDVTNLFSKGTKMRVTSASGVQTFYVTGATFNDPNTDVTLAGETSVSSIITTVEYSYMDAPQGFKRGEDWYRSRQFRGSSMGSTQSTFEYHPLSNAGNIDPNGDIVAGIYITPISGYYSFDGNIYSSASQADWMSVVGIGGDIQNNDAPVSYGTRVSSDGFGSHISDMQYIPRGYQVLLGSFQSSVSNGVLAGNSKDNYIAIQFKGI